MYRSRAVLSECEVLNCSSARTPLNLVQNILGCAPTTIQRDICVPGLVGVKVIRKRRLAVCYRGFETYIVRPRVSFGVVGREGRIGTD